LHYIEFLLCADGFDEDHPPHSLTIHYQPIRSTYFTALHDLLTMDATGPRGPFRFPWNGTGGTRLGDIGETNPTERSSRLSGSPIPDTCPKASHESNQRYFEIS